MIPATIVKQIKKKKKKLFNIFFQFLMKLYYCLISPRRFSINQLVRRQQSNS